MTYTYPARLNLTGQSFPGFGDAERITGTEVYSGFFPLLGVQPLLGRWLLPEEQGRGRNRVIVLSYGFWQRRFGGTPDILGQSLTLDGRIYTVVGVMPPGFRFNEGRVSDFWIPLAHGAAGRFVHQYSAYARLKPSVSVETAQTQMSAIAKRLEEAYPESNTGWGVKVTRFRDALMETFGPALLVFFAAVGVVLLIACANVANLLLARASARTSEIAIRRALGAGRSGIIRPLLTESILLAVAAASLGLLLTLWGIDLAIAASPAWLDLESILYVDGNVLVFTLLLSILTGILTGLVPALQSSGTDVNENLKQGGGAVRAGIRRSRALSAFVVSEVALCVVLLVAAGLLTKSFIRLLEVDLGYRTGDVLTVRMELPRTKYRRAHQRVQFYQALVERVRSLPGVLSAGGIDAIPMGGVLSGGGIEIEGRSVPRDWTQMSAAYRYVTPDYFRTLAIPLLKGRYFTDQDRSGSEPVVIINELLARQFFPNEDPLGKKIQAGGNEWLTIVGVVGDVCHNGPERPPMLETYRPHAQVGYRRMFLAVQTAPPPSRLIQAVRAEVRTLDRELPITQVRTMDQALSESVSMRRHIMSLIDFFAFVAMVLAAVGLGGLVWYSVSQRTHEIGVRKALGAQRTDILRLVLGRGLRLTLVGLVIGLGAAFAVTRLLASFLYGISPWDPAVFAIVPVLLAAVALAASYIPARRAANVDPMAALRHE